MLAPQGGPIAALLALASSLNFNRVMYFLLTPTGAD